MDSHDRTEIRYAYGNAALSPSLVKHTWQYLSAITGIAYIEDNRSPDITYAQTGEIRETAKIIIRGGKLCIKNENSERIALEFDPIIKLANALSLAPRMGPLSDMKVSPSPNHEPTLSEVIAKFVNILKDAGLIYPDFRPASLWPDSNSFALALTHDIDIVRRSVLGGIRLLWKRHLPGGLGAIFDSARAGLLNSPNPYDRICEWIRLETEIGLKSTFFVFDGWRQHANDPKYKLDILSRDFDAIRSREFELALHTGIGCHSGEHIAESKKSLEDSSGMVVYGLRPHYLSAFFAQYWKAAIASGCSFSSSYGFDEEIGFLQGIDLPIIPFDAVAQKPLDIVEIPIAIMDCGLIGKLSAASEEVFERGKMLIERCARSGGLVVLDWHERTLYGRDYPGWGPLYFRLVEFALSKGAYVPLMSDIVSSLTNRFKGRP